MASLIDLVDMRNPKSFASRMRARRLRFFLELIARLPRPLTICDIGGTLDFWRHLDLAADDDVRVTIVNMYAEECEDARFRMIVGDARALPFADASFDVVYSNSVIEHVGELEEQARMAREVARIGTRYFVQTPNFYFPIEPHFLFPGFQWLPIRVRAWLLTKRRLGWVERETDFAKAAEVARSINLLRLRDLKSMFPRSSIYHERLAGLSKSFTAYKGF